jgi:hypothetical protein
MDRIVPMLFKWAALWTAGFAALMYTNSADFLIPFIGVWAMSFVFCPLLSVYFDRHPEYRLLPMTWTWKDLVYQLDSTIEDLCFIFPICVLVASKLGITLVLTDPDAVSNFYYSPLSWLMIPVTNMVGLVWRMAIHVVLHHPKLYKWHKRHHALPENMTPFIAWNDSIVEFLFMEFFGVMFLPIVLNPVPMPVLTIIWSWQILDGVLNHQNLKVPGSWWLDTEYHTVHHIHVRHNYAEWELLDKLAGTLYTQDLDIASYIKSRGLSQGQQVDG